jgi:hypothetical protein
MWSNVVGPVGVDRTNNIAAHNHYDTELKVRVRAGALDASVLLISNKQVGSRAFNFSQQQPVKR